MQITLPNKSVNVPTFGTDPNRTYKINPPTSVDVVGSFSSRTIVRPYESVDIVIQVSFLYIFSFSFSFYFLN